MLKTTQELRVEKQYLIERLNTVNAELDKRTNVLNVEGNKPFIKFSINEMNDLYNANETAYEWFNEEENHNKTIDEYNETHKTNKVFI